MDFKKNIEELTSHHISLKDEQLNNFKSWKELEELMHLEVNTEGLPTSEREKFVKDYLKYAVNTSHPLYANQLWSKVESSSVLGEYLASITNTSMYTYEVAPIATILEHKMIDYLTEIIWGDKRSGVMTSGGTASNLQALMCARNSHYPNAKEQGISGLTKKPVIITANNCHYSIKRSVNILGLGHESLIEVEANDKGQIEPQKLADLITDLKSRGFDPFCVVSTAGSTIEGSYDDIKSIGKICQSEGIWFHVDGAYGGSVLLTKKYRKLMEGVELANSVTWDFHKVLGLNLPCAFVFVKDKNVLKKSLTTKNDSYLFHDEESVDLGPKSLQCGRRNDILKLWMYWQEVGSVGIEKKMDELFDISFSFAEMVKKRENFELLLDPQSINICFRYKSRDGKRHEDEIRERLNKEGKLMINYSTYSDGPFFRLAVTNTHLRESGLEKILDMIEKAACEI